MLPLHSWRRNGASSGSAAGSRVSSSASAMASVSAARARAARSPVSALLDAPRWRCHLARLNPPALSLLFTLLPAGFLVGLVSLDGLAHVVAGGWVAVLRAGRASGAGLAGFRRAGQAGQHLADVTEPPADPGRGQPGRAGPLPGQPDVGGQAPGEPELGVRGDDQPGPATSRTCPAVTSVASSAGPSRTASSGRTHDVRPGSSAATSEYGQPGIICAFPFPRA